MKKTLIVIVIIGLILLVAGKLIMNLNENDNNELSLMNKEVLSFEGDTNIINKEFDNVKNINLTLGIYSIVIQGDSNIKNVQLTAKKPTMIVNGLDVDKLEIDYKDGNLTVRQKQDKKWIGSFNFNDYKGELLIKIPTKNELSKIDIDNGVGDIEIKDISADYLDIDCGTSPVLARNIKISNCNISGGTGSIKLYDISTDKIKIDSGTGSTYISGDINKQATINTGTSSVELELKGKEKDYDYDIKTGLGSIEINNNKYKREAKIDNKSNSANIKINAGTGSVDIKTK